MNNIADDVVGFLEDFCQIEGTEFGEMIAGLLAVYRRRDMISDELRSALFKEIQDTYDHIKDEWTLLETEETYTHKVKEWVMKDDCY